jgi:hypothetical protein
MTRFLLSAAVAAVGLALLAAPETRADQPPGHGRGYSTGRHYRGHGHYHYRASYRGHGFRASHRFHYHRYGYRSLRWTRSFWSSQYRCYCYWAPQYRCWFFYEPTYSYYVPVTYYREVYAEAPPVTAPVFPSPSVVQQTTVVVPPSAPVAEPVPPGPVAGPGPVAPVAPAPVAVQKTRVGPGAP